MIIGLSRLQVTFDPDRCKNCGYCSETAPEMFKMGDGANRLVNGIARTVIGDTIAVVPVDSESVTVLAANECPSGALEIIYPDPPTLFNNIA